MHGGSLEETLHVCSVSNRLDLYSRKMATKLYRLGDYSYKFWHKIRHCSRSSFRQLTGIGISGPLFSPIFSCFFFLSSMFQKTYLKKVNGSIQTLLAFLGHLATILDLTGGGVFQAVHCIAGGERVPPSPLGW